MSAQISKKRKFVADGVFRAELNDFFTRELSEEGYSGCDVRVTHARTEVRTLCNAYLMAPWTCDFRLSSAPHIPKKFSVRKVAVSASLPPSSKNDSNSPRTPSNSTLRRCRHGVSPLLRSARVCDTSFLVVFPSVGEAWNHFGRHAVCLHGFRACYGVLRFVMESGAKGCEVVVSGKLRAARAKSMKFTDGFMIHSGQPARDFVDYAVRHVLLRQGVLGIKVKMYVRFIL